MHALSHTQVPHRRQLNPPAHRSSLSTGTSTSLAQRAETQDVQATPNRHSANGMGHLIVSRVLPGWGLRGLWQSPG